MTSLFCDDVHHIDKTVFNVPLSVDAVILVKQFIILPACSVPGERLELAALWRLSVMPGRARDRFVGCSP